MPKDLPVNSDSDPAKDVSWSDVTVWDIRFSTVSGAYLPLVKLRNSAGDLLAVFNCWNTDGLLPVLAVGNFPSLHNIIVKSQLNFDADDETSVKSVIKQISLAGIDHISLLAKLDDLPALEHWSRFDVDGWDELNPTPLTGQVLFESTPGVVTPSGMNPLDFDLYGRVLCDAADVGIEIDPWIPTFSDAAALADNAGWRLDFLPEWLDWLEQILSPYLSYEGFVDASQSSVRDYEHSVIQDLISNYPLPQRLYIDHFRYTAGLLQDGRDCYENIEGFVQSIHDVLPESIELAGYMFKPRDKIWSGQDYALLEPYLDVFSPMLYWQDWGSGMDFSQAARDYVQRAIASIEETSVPLSRVTPVLSPTTTIDYASIDLGSLDKSGALWRQCQLNALGALGDKGIVEYDLFLWGNWLQRPGFKGRDGKVWSWAKWADYFDSFSNQLSIEPHVLPYNQQFDANEASSLKGWTFYSSTNQGRIDVVDGRLHMDDSVCDDKYSLNEAVVHLDLVGQDNIVLTLDHVNVGDENDTLPVSFDGHRNGDGISISVDGQHWEKVADLGESFNGRHFKLDGVLQQAKVLAGTTDVSNVRIKFQQYGSLPAPDNGREFDNIQIEAASGGQASISVAQYRALALRDAASHRDEWEEGLWEDYPTAFSVQIAANSIKYEPFVVHGLSEDAVSVRQDVTVAYKATIRFVTYDIDGNPRIDETCESATFTGSAVGQPAQRMIDGTDIADVIILDQVMPTFAIFGRGGDDVIDLSTSTCSSVVDGGPGNDTMHGGSGSDEIRGGAGGDSIAGGFGSDWLYGGAGNDAIHGGGGDDRIFGNEDSDTREWKEMHGLVGGPGNDIILGDDGLIIYDGVIPEVELFGSAGDDEIHGGDGNDWVYGGGGADTLYGDAGSDCIFGNDNPAGDGNEDELHGGDGNDIVLGDNGLILLSGPIPEVELGHGGGRDKIYGDGGDDWLFGDTDQDTIYGGDDDDFIFGQARDLFECLRKGMGRLQGRHQPLFLQGER